jgi:cobalamin biosynthesis Co2+ chelatase CbiK
MPAVGTPDCVHVPGVVCVVVRDEVCRGVRWVIIVLLCHGCNSNIEQSYICLGVSTVQ